MKKDFSQKSPAERDVEARSLDRAFSFEETRPMSAASQEKWKQAKRGRPRKPAGEKAERVLISIEPKLLAMVEQFASINGIDRSRLFALSVQAFMVADHAHRQVVSGAVRQSGVKRASA
jgi:hypothetical protein